MTIADAFILLTLLVISVLLLVLNLNVLHKIKEIEKKINMI